MLRTLKAIIESDGTVRLLERVTLGRRCRALVTVLGEGGKDDVPPDALLTEHALGEWLRPEEDEAWAHLQPDAWY
jgi:hypothetical protein